MDVRSSDKGRCYRSQGSRALPALLPTISTNKQFIIPIGGSHLPHVNVACLFEQACAIEIFFLFEEIFELESFGVIVLDFANIFLFFSLLQFYSLCNRTM